MKWKLHKSESYRWWYEHMSPYKCPGCGDHITWGDWLCVGRCGTCYDKLVAEYMHEMERREEEEG